MRIWEGGGWSAVYALLKSTKVLNPQRCIMRVHEKYACGTDTHAVQIRSYQLLKNQ